VRSPVGRALPGARAGDVTHVRLPNGRDRVLTVLAVTSGAPQRAAERSDGSAAAGALCGRAAGAALAVRDPALEDLGCAVLAVTHAEISENARSVDAVGTGE
jgi:hypothetical protein